MKFLTLLAGLVLDTAHASPLDSIGAGPGIAQMWGMISSIFPFTDTGGSGAVIITTKILNAVLGIIATASAAALIYAGIQLVTAAGEDSKVTEARKTALYAILGVFLAAVARVVILYAAALITAAVGG